MQSIWSSILQRGLVDIPEQPPQYPTLHQIPAPREIPFDQKFVYALVNLKPAVIFEPEYTGKFLEILKEMIKNINFWDTI